MPDSFLADGCHPHPRAARDRGGKSLVRLDKHRLSNFSTIGQRWLARGHQCVDSRSQKPLPQTVVIGQKELEAIRKRAQSLFKESR
jgi:hypothetical protein